jgi:hypothetical protein
MTQDYNGLPAPWQWLKDAKPEPGQHCEWVALGPSWTGTGQVEGYPHADHLTRQSNVSKNHGFSNK